MNKVLYDAALWREHDGWVTYKCNVEQMPRYAMLEAYGSPPIEKAIQAALDAAWAEGYAAGRKAGLMEAKEMIGDVYDLDLIEHMPDGADYPSQRKMMDWCERLAQQAEGGADEVDE